MSETRDAKACAAAPDAEPRGLVWNPELVTRFWDYQARFPEKYFTAQFGRRLVQVVRRWFPAGGRILDYACGTGALTGHLLDAGLQTAACDLSPESVAVTQRRFAGKAGFLGACTAAQLENLGGDFDGVLLVELVEHVDGGILNKILDDVRRALRVGGVLVVSTPNDEFLPDETVYCPCCNHTFHRWQHVRSWSPSSLSEMLRTQGFEPVGMLTTDLSLSAAQGTLRYLAKRSLDAIRRRKMPHLIGIARRTA